MDKNKKAKLKASKGRHAAKAKAESEAQSARPPVEIGADGRALAAARSPEPDETTSPDPGTVPVQIQEQPFVLADAGKRPGKRGRKVLKAFGILLGSIAGLAVIAYAAGCFYFADRFFPNTVIGDFDVSLQTTAEAQETLQAGLADYRIKVEGQGLSFELGAQDAALALDGDEILAKALGDGHMWTWPFELQKHHDESDKLSAEFSEASLDGAVRQRVEAFNEDATPPEDATVGYADDAKKFQVVPEKLGTALDPDAVVEAVGSAMTSMAPKATVGADSLLKPPILSDDPALAAACDDANALMAADFTLTTGGTQAAAVGPDQISSWIVFDENLEASLDEGLMIAWIEELAAGFNTVGSERTFTRPDGKVVTVAGGTYGWSVDHDTLLTVVRDGVARGQTGEVEIPVFQSAAFYAGAGQRDWAGYVDVDLSEQYARFYDNNDNVIWETAIITGVPNAEKATPAGVYYVTTKASPTTLNTYEGKKEPKKTVVQYWMPFVGNVIGLHDAWWQPGFGGTMYRDGYGSHGCVNLPSAKAQVLYGMLGIGDVVVVHW